MIPRVQCRAEDGIRRGARIAIVSGRPEMSQSPESRVQSRAENGIRRGARIAIVPGRPGTIAIGVEERKNGGEPVGGLYMRGMALVDLTLS